MEIIQFLEATEQKNIKSFIGMKVKKKLLEYETFLQGRQEMLRNILEFENSQYGEELAQLANDKLKEQFQKRLDWINTSRMESRNAEEELLKLKNQQRDLGNCEKWRHFVSKQLLVDSKKGQLYQIEDKKLRIQKEKHIDELWQQVMKRLDSEKAYQEEYKNKLLKVTETANQFLNQEINNNNKKQEEFESQQAKKEFQEGSRKASFMEENYRKDENVRKSLKTRYQNQMLKDQISSNLDKKVQATKLLTEEGLSQKQLLDRNLLSEVEQADRQKFHNNQWQKYYLKNCQNEKQKKIEGDNEFERMYLNTGCVVQQVPKNPYGKSSR